MGGAGPNVTVDESGQSRLSLGEISLSSPGCKD